jgi:pimeloyl-ACP methyl ester carboxylesterase
MLKERALHALWSNNVRRRVSAAHVPALDFGRIAALPALAHYAVFTRVQNMNAGTQLARSREISMKRSVVLRQRMQTALETFRQRYAAAMGQGPEATTRALPLVDPWRACLYAVDSAQRTVLFWNTLHERGNDYIEHARGGQPPVLHFDYETIVDGRNLEQPVNYALLRITPPTGVVIDEGKRPYIIIDPRAGHGPGIGGFKDDSQVGVALRAGHPVYFVIFFRDPEPGQTLLDVCNAEQQFVQEVRRRHPDSAKPALIGNCQGGWAAMMLASSDPQQTGPVIINGAPMSYWGGAWSTGAGDNPMRYAGGMLGGTWLSSLLADLGNGNFDGAWLVQNFESLNPANTWWDKYYHLYSNVDTEPPRFLEFERWWGGYFLMNREEIEWITRNLFVGNRLWTGEVKDSAGAAFDLREIQSPIVLFASMGDNITPPQQAFNWVSDIYGSTAEIKARGQVIVGLMHQDVGHLGIFVSGKVARKEHAQIVSVLDEIEILPPGLYGMHISEHKGAQGKTYDVEFREYRLEEITAYFNRFGRNDELPFEAVDAISEFNQRAYELFARPAVQATANDLSASLMRQFHPLRVQHWAMSWVNPMTAWLAPAAEQVKQQRLSLPPEHPLIEAEKAHAELISAGLDLYRATRDALTESAFFASYANLYALNVAEKHQADAGKKTSVETRELPYVQEALARMAEGGYNEALARVLYLLSRKGEAISIAQLEKRAELIGDLPRMPLPQWRRIRGEQEIIARFEPEQAFNTLPVLLANQSERKKLLTLLDKLMTDKRAKALKPTAEQRAMLARIRAILSGQPARERHLAVVRQA